MDEDNPNHFFYKLFICEQCAEKRKGYRPVDYSSTLFKGECDFCYKMKCISSVEDWIWEEKPGLKMVRDD